MGGSPPPTTLPGGLIDYTTTGSSSGRSEVLRIYPTLLHAYAFLINRRLGRSQGKIKDLWA
jgi:hypothetical protein